MPSYRDAFPNRVIDMTRSSTIRIRTSGTSYLVRLSKSDTDNTLAFLAFWFVWSQRNQLADFLQTLFEVFA